MCATETPLVTVLVPAWNAATTLERAVASVLAETGVDLECVVVDDGSTDSTVAIADGLAARDPRVRVIRSPGNEGVSAARNRGLESVRGSWLTFLDADDRLLPGGLAALAAPTNGDALAVIGQRVWSDGERTWVSTLYDIPDIRTPGRKSLARNSGLLYYASATGKLIHRSCWEDFRFYGRVLGDQPWTIRALLRAGDRIDVIGDVVYEWSRPRHGEAGTSITSVTRSSVTHGVEAASVAIQALTDVSAEASACLPDRDATAVSTRYVERLLRSDLAMHLARAVERRDPETARLLGAIEAFVASVPAEIVGTPDTLVQDILERLLPSWTWLDADARAAYGSLVSTSYAASPGLATRASGPFARLALARVAAGGRSLGAVIVVAGAVATGRRIARGVLRRVRRTASRLAKRTPGLGQGPSGGNRA